MPSSWSRFSVAYCALCIVLGALTLFKLSGCGRSMAQGLRPDLAGTWDLVYDDVIDVEVTLGSETYRSRVSREGGVLSWLDGGAQHALHIDCSRPELVCPNETLDSQLRLTNRLGDVDDDGERLVISLLGEGEGACRLAKGSAAQARIESHGSPDAKTWRGVALTDGLATSVISAACLDDAPDHQVTKSITVRLSSAFSAVRR